MLISDSDPVTLCAVGDISLGDSPKMLGIGVRSASNFLNGECLFNNVRQALQADLVFGNLEGVLSNIGFNPGSFKRAQLRGKPSMVGVLRDVGFNVLNVANNHMMQYGPQPFLETCKLLEKAGIAVVGLKGEEGWGSQPVVLSVRGKKIAFLGYADNDNYGHEPLYSLNRRDNVIADISRLRNDVDILVVSLHWGDEFVRAPSPACRAYGREIISAGVDIVLGHHPHVIQSIEMHRSGWICYSLGNFISDMIWNPLTVEGLLVKVKLPIAKNTSIRVDKILIDASFVPINSPFTLRQLDELVQADESDSQSEIEYMSLVESRKNENRKLGHLHLVKCFYKYSLITYFLIWSNSIKNLYRSLNLGIFYGSSRKS